MKKSIASLVDRVFCVEVRKAYQLAIAGCQAVKMCGYSEMFDEMWDATHAASSRFENTATQPGATRLARAFAICKALPDQQRPIGHRGFVTGLSDDRCFEFPEPWYVDIEESSYLVTGKLEQYWIVLATLYYLVT